VNNLHGIPGIFGGFVSAAIIAFYQVGYDVNVASFYGPSNIFGIEPGTFIRQAGLQIAATLVSVAMGIAFGYVAGVTINFFYQ
jgi:hypothetical protein